MIAAWMAYALVIASLVSVAALIAERIAILRRLQSRWIWVAALLLSLALPMLFAWNGARPSERPATTLVALAAQERPPVYEQSPIAWVGGDSRDCHATRPVGHVAARRMVSAECARSGDAVDGMDAAQTTPAVCR